MWPRLDDRELDVAARRAARGDRHSFGIVCATIEGDIWRYCRSVLRNDPAAEDATQETFARIVTAIGRYRGDAPVRVWALVIARRVCSDLIRRDARIETPSDPHRSDHTLPPTSIHRGRLTSPEHDALLDELAPDDRAAFVLTQLLGFSYDEAAEVAAVPVGTIRSRVHRARSRLADLWLAADLAGHGNHDNTDRHDRIDRHRRDPREGTAMDICDHTRRHLGAMRDREAFADAAVDGHLADCADCRAWLDGVDQLTRSMRLRPVSQPTFVDGALALWDARQSRRSAIGTTAGRLMLAIAALGCLLVGVSIAAGSAGHTHTGVTAQREVIILEVALAFGLACAAARPRTFLPGILPILGVVAVVNVGVSMINLIVERSGLLGEIAHLPFLVGLLGALLIHRADPIGTVPVRGARRDRLHA